MFLDKNCPSQLLNSSGVNIGVLKRQTLFGT